MSRRRQNLPITNASIRKIDLTCDLAPEEPRTCHYPGCRNQATQIAFWTRANHRPTIYFNRFLCDQHAETWKRRHRDVLTTTAESDPS